MKGRFQLHVSERAADVGDARNEANTVHPPAGDCNTARTLQRYTIAIEANAEEGQAHPSDFVALSDNSYRSFSGSETEPISQSAAPFRPH